MTAEEAIWIDGSKYMWDGKVYESQDEANGQATTYGADGFETQVAEADGKYLVYTRRVVTEIVVDGEAPI